MEGVILGRKKIGEADRLITLFTRERGVLRTIAKGVRKVPSHRGGHVEPLTRVFALVNESRAGMYVSSVQTQEYYSTLHSNAVALEHARVLAMAIRRLFDEDEAQPELYDAYTEALELLPQLPSHKQQLLEGTVHMLALEKAGLMPDLTACRRCKKAKPTDAIILQAQEGGWTCLTCHSSFLYTQFSLTPRLLQAVRFITMRPEAALRLVISPEESYQLIQAIRSFVAGTVGQPVGV